MAVVDVKPLTRKEARVIAEIAQAIQSALDSLRPEDRDTGPMLRTKDVLATLERALAERESRSRVARLFAPYVETERPHVHEYLSGELDVMRQALARN